MMNAEGRVQNVWRTNLHSALCNLQSQSLVGFLFSTVALLIALNTSL